MRVRRTAASAASLRPGSQARVSDPVVRWVRAAFYLYPVLAFAAAIGAAAMLGDDAFEAHPAHRPGLSAPCPRWWEGKTRSASVPANLESVTLISMRPPQPIVGLSRLPVTPDLDRRYNEDQRKQREQNTGWQDTEQLATDEGSKD